MMLADIIHCFLADCAENVTQVDACLQCERREGCDRPDAYHLDSLEEARIFYSFGVNWLTHLMYRMR